MYISIINTHLRNFILNNVSSVNQSTPRISSHRKLRKFPYNWAVKARASTCIGNLNRDTNNIVRHPSADKGPRWSINRKHIWHYILPSGCLATRLLQIAETSETILIFFLFERIDTIRAPSSILQMEGSR